MPLTHRGCQQHCRSPRPWLGRCSPFLEWVLLALEVRLFPQSECLSYGWSTLSLVHGDTSSARSSSFITDLDHSSKWAELRLRHQAASTENTVWMVPLWATQWPQLRAPEGARLSKEAPEEIGGRRDWGQEGSSAYPRPILSEAPWQLLFKRGKEPECYSYGIKLKPHPYDNPVKHGSGHNWHSRPENTCHSSM